MVIAPTVFQGSSGPGWCDQGLKPGAKILFYICKRMHKSLFVYDRKWQLPLLCYCEGDGGEMQVHVQLRSTNISICFVDQVISADPFINLQGMDPTTPSYWYQEQWAVFPSWQKTSPASITAAVGRLLFSCIKALRVLFELLWFSLSWIQVPTPFCDGGVIAML